MIMQKEYYLINETAKEVKVEAHVLRYWEEELGLPIKRNAKGHRLYTGEDVLRFIKIKKLKEEGLQLKAIKKLLKEVSLEETERKEDKVVNFQIKKEMEYSGKDKVSDIIAGLQEEKNISKEEEEQVSPFRIEIKQPEYMQEDAVMQDMGEDKSQKREVQMIENLQTMDHEKQEKAMRIQALLRHMINDSIQIKQQDMIQEIKDNMSKEFDYQFRQFEEQQTERERKMIEREELREKEQKEREEKHFKKIDELLRLASVKGKTFPNTRKKLS